MKTTLHRLSWCNVLALLILIYVFGGAFLQRYTALPLAAFACALLVLAKYLADLPYQWRYARESLTLAGKCQYLLPSCVPAFVEITWAAGSGFLLWVARRKAPEQAGLGTPLGYLKKGQYNTLLWLGGISLIGDVPISALLIGVFTHDPVLRLHAHLVFGAITLWSMVALLGDSYWIRRTSHSLNGDMLQLEISRRFYALVPAASIDHAEFMDGSPYSWRTAHKIKGRDTMLVTPFDTPNVIVVLRSDAEVEASVFKVRCTLPRYLFLYVDEPGVLVKRFARTVPVNAAAEQALAAG